MKKSYIVGIKVDDVNPSYTQIVKLAELFDTQKIDNTDGLQIVCFVNMQAYKARIEIREILNCTFSQIRIKYHEK